MKKRDFKKLMLLGISAGALVASQAGASGQLLANSCGGRHGCGGSYMPAQSQGCGAMPNYNNNNNGTTTGTGTSTGSGQGSGGYTAYQPTHGCSAHQTYYNNSAQSYQQQAQGCGAMPQSSQGYQSAQGYQANSGCGGTSQSGYNNTRPMSQVPQAQSNYTQWSNTTGYTADSMKQATTTTTTQHQQGQPYTEAELLSSTSPLGATEKMIYQGLDEDGRKTALKMINDNPNQNPNVAVKTVAQQMAQKRAGAPPR